MRRSQGIRILSISFEMERPPVHVGDLSPQLSTLKNWTHHLKCVHTLNWSSVYLIGFISTGQYKLNRTPDLTPVKHLNQRICLTQPDKKKKLFGGKSETELEVYLCTGKQKKCFRREKLHRRFRDISHIPCFTDFNQKKKKRRLHRRFSTFLFLSCHPTFKASQILTKKKKKASENKFNFRASLFLSCQNRGISENFLNLILFDV